MTGDFKAGKNPQETESIAIGQGAKARDGHIADRKSSIAIGKNAVAQGYTSGSNTAIAIGQSSSAGGWSVALGEGAYALTESALAMGYAARANAFYAISLGRDAVSDLESVALGYDARAVGKKSLSLGKSAHTTGLFGTSIGYQAETKGQSAISMGMSAKSEGEGSIAIGSGYIAGPLFKQYYVDGAIAQGKYSVSIGRDTKATVEGGIALGYGSETTDGVVTTAGYAPSNNNADRTGNVWIANRAAVSIGKGADITRRITGVAAGVNDTDAVNVAQLKRILSTEGGATSGVANASGWEIWGDGDSKIGDVAKLESGNVTKKQVKFLGTDNETAVNISSNNSDGYTVKIGLDKSITAELGNIKDKADKADLATKLDKNSLHLITSSDINVGSSGNLTTGNVSLSIKDNVITTNKIKDGNVTKNKLGDDVTSILNKVGTGTIDDESTTNANTVTGKAVKDYVEGKLANVSSTIAYKGNVIKTGQTEPEQQTVALSKGLHFISEDVDIEGNSEGELNFKLKDSLINSLTGKGVDGKDSKNGADANSAGSYGLTAQDGLNGKTTNDKVNAIRNGEVGTLVYTDKEGNRLVKANDGKYYKLKEVKADGTVKEAKDNGGNVPPSVDKPLLSLVNSAGETSKDSEGVTLGHITSALGVVGDLGTKFNDDGKKQAAITNAKDLLNSDKGLLKLTDTNDKVKLNSAATVRDLQALSIAGLEFTGNSYKDQGILHKALGGILTIKGEGTDTAKTKTNNEYAENKFGSASGNIQVDSKGTEMVIKLSNRLDNLESAVFTKTNQNGTKVKTTVEGDGTTVKELESNGSPKEKNGKVAEYKLGGTTLTNGDKKSTLTAENLTFGSKDQSGSDKTSTVLGKDGLTVNGKDGKADVEIKAGDDTSAPKIVLNNGLDGDNSKPSVTITAGKDKVGPSINFANTGTGNDAKGTGTITGLKDLDDNSDSTSAVNKNYVDSKLNKTDKVVGNGSDGLDGQSGTDVKSTGSKGLTGKDGLNGKDLTTKVNALRNGEAGTVVYTNEKGERLAKANNGDYYLVNDLTEKGEPKEGKTKATTVIVSLVNPDGSTIGKPIAMNNVASALGLSSEIGQKYNSTKTNSKEKANEMVQGVQLAQQILNGNDKTGNEKFNGLLALKDEVNQPNATLNSVATLRDLQAVSIAGLDFIGNSYKDHQTVHRSLGSTVTIKGEGTDTTKIGDTYAENKFESAAGNIQIQADNNTNELIVKLSKRLDNLESATFAKKEENGKATKTVVDGKGSVVKEYKQKNNASDPVEYEETGNVAEYTLGGTKLVEKSADGKVENTLTQTPTETTMEKVMADADDNKTTDTVTIATDGTHIESVDSKTKTKKTADYKLNGVILDDGKDTAKLTSNEMKFESKDTVDKTATTVSKSGVTVKGSNGKTDIEIKASTTTDVAKVALKDKTGNQDAVVLKGADDTNAGSIIIKDKAGNHDSVILKGADGTKGSSISLSDKSGTESIKIDGEAKTITGIADLTDASDGSSVANKNYVNEKLADANAGQPFEYYTTDTTTKQDVKVVRGRDGKLYKETDLTSYKFDPKTKKYVAKNGGADMPANLAIDSDQVVVKAMPKEKPLSISNVASGLDATKIGKTDLAKPISPEEAKALISEEGGDKALNNLKEMSKLNTSATVGDLQALSIAGLGFTGNDGQLIHRSLGNTLDLLGEMDQSKDGYVDLTKQELATATNNIAIVKKEVSNGYAKPKSVLEVQLASHLSNIDSLTTSKTADGHQTVLAQKGVTVTQEDKTDGTTTAATLTSNGTSIAKTKVDQKGQPEVVQSAEYQLGGTKLEDKTTAGTHKTLNQTAGGTTTTKVVKDAQGNTISEETITQTAGETVTKKISFENGNKVTETITQTAGSVKTHKVLEDKDGHTLREEMVTQNTSGMEIKHEAAGKAQQAEYKLNGTSLTDDKGNKSKLTAQSLTFGEPQAEGDNADKTSTVINKSGISINGKSGQPDIQILSGTDKQLPTIGFATIGQGAQAKGTGVISGLADLTEQSPGHYATNKNYVDNKFNTLETQLNHSSKILKAGIAGSNAAASLPQAHGIGRSMVAIAAGTFKGQSAVAVGYSRLSDNGKVTFKIQGNSNTQGDVGGGVGIGYQW